MTYDKELKKIKKVYGERFMKMCRELFPDILEEEGKLFEILESSFSNNSQTLYEDIQNGELQYKFKAFVYGKFRTADKDEEFTNKSPYELLEEAGYDLYECKNEDEIQSFKKYYAQGEELCTFNGGRLNKCEVFFAVKKDVEDIKREDFEEPEREDQYGTSVMGIQFNREGLCTVSIKNRYNHTVINPDATYGNNLENIIPGLTQSFKMLLQERGLELDISNSEQFTIPGYVVANDGKYYKYNMEIDGTYYCPGNIVIKNNTPHNLGQKEKSVEPGIQEKIEPQGNKILIDYFVLDTAKKTIEVYDKSFQDSFTSYMEDIVKIEMIKNKEKGDGVRTITVYKKEQEQPIIIDIDKDNQIIGYTNYDLKILYSNFCSYNKALAELNTPQLVSMGVACFRNNEEMTKLNAPELTHIGNACFEKNMVMTELNVPQLEHMGDSCFYNNRKITKLNMSQLEDMGERCFYNNEWITELNMPQLEHMGKDCFYRNEWMTELNVPQLEHMGDSCFNRNRGITKLNISNLKYMGEHCFELNEEMTELNASNLKYMGDYCFANNKGITELHALQLTHMGSRCFASNMIMTELNVPQLEHMGERCFFCNKEMTELNVPQLKRMGDSCFYNNVKMIKLDAPQIEHMGEGCFYCNKEITGLNTTQFEEIADEGFNSNQEITELNVAQLTDDVEEYFQTNEELNKEIDSKQIAYLDKENELTTSEVSWERELLGE